jgi:citrate lyase beta subunit
MELLLNARQKRVPRLSRRCKRLILVESEKLVRINPVESGMADEDLHAVLPGHPDGVVIPKVGSAEQVRWVSARLAEAERAWLAKRQYHSFSADRNRSRCG